MSCCFPASVIGVSVEQFRGALCVAGGLRAGEWIVGRGKCGQCAGRAGSGADLGSNGDEQIFNLLFYARNALIFNDSRRELDTFAAIGATGLAEFDQGGRGSVASAGRCLFNTLGLTKFIHIARGSENQAPKKEGGAGRPYYDTTTMNHPKCLQCGLSSMIDCEEEGCPGVGGIRPETWARPLMQMAQDLERHKALILECAAWFTTQQMLGDVVLKVEREAQAIRAKQKKGGAA